MFTHRRAVPMEIGHFFFRLLVSLYSAVKYCDPKFRVVPGLGIVGYSLQC